MRKARSLLWCSALLAMGVPSTALAGDPAKDPAASSTSQQTRIEIGNKAPDFTLNDGAGKTHQLSEVLKKHSMVALVFYRSADW